MEQRRSRRRQRRGLKEATAGSRGGCLGSGYLKQRGDHGGVEKHHESRNDGGSKRRVKTGNQNLMERGNKEREDRRRDQVNAKSRFERPQSAPH
jgi:hypothetical protein